MRKLCEGLEFPEGPIAMDDGSVLVVEIKRGCLSRVAASGQIERVADCGGGPNGAAIGPDGRVYICNNGGFTWGVVDGFTRPLGTPANYQNGSIQVVDLGTGKVETIYDACDGDALKGPNDIVFDDRGGFYFTDLGKRYDHALDRGAVYYALADGSSIKRIVAPIEQPNGIGLSPDGTRLYVAETFMANLRYWDITSPGELAPHDDPFGVGNILHSFDSFARLDSLAVDSEGNVCVATLGSGCITAIAPGGGIRAMIPVPARDIMVTNICFGGADLRTAYITSSGLGILYAADWHCPGHLLNY